MTDGSQHVPLLADLDWKTSYRREDGDLVGLFYTPALRSAVQYDRMTGYFSAGALALAARGLQGLLQNDGRMRLVVGCTLGPSEVEAIEKGYDLRRAVEDRLVGERLEAPDHTARNGIEMLAWLVEHARLEIKVAVPVGLNGKPVVAAGIYHEKVGIVTDAAGSRLSFSGSNNETPSGWVHNVESFHVHCDWLNDRDKLHVEDEVEAFKRIWSDEAAGIKVYDFPEAARKKLLEFLPSADMFISPPLPTNPEDTEAYRLTDDEVRRIVWTFIEKAPHMPNGIRVGEVTSVVEPWPHQLRTYVDFVRNWPSRLLVADEVGLGKTITAGLILRQLWLSKKARRILLLVPKAVISQWQDELYEKFNLNVPIYDGAKLAWKMNHGRMAPIDKAVERDSWHHEPFVLCSSHLARRRDRAEELLAAEPWDLVVLDEAHHARRRGGVDLRANRSNALLRLMRELKDRTTSLLLLTATPMQVHPVEVYDLLALLGLPPRWDESYERFVSYFEKAGGNPSDDDLAALAQMFQAAETAYGEVQEEEIARTFPKMTGLTRRGVLGALHEKGTLRFKRMNPRQREALTQVLQRFSPLRYLMARQTRDLLRTYYQRGKLSSPIAERDVRDIAVEMSRSERELYEAAEDYISTTYNNAEADRRTAVGFVMTIYRRRLASSLHALRQTLNNRLAKLAGGDAQVLTEEDLDLDETRDEVMDAEEASELSERALVAEERGSIQELLRKIATCDSQRESKAKRLLEELMKAFSEGYDSAIVFTQYTDTMNALKNFLAAELPDFPIATYRGGGGERLTLTGGWEACSKERVKLDLKQGKIKLLVCTDAAGEGLNLQYCGVLANFDLPWNPMKVEQRIGRIDRIGQKYEHIRVLNFAYQDTVEADVYFALGSRINLFRKIVGKLQPILSQLPQRFEEVSLRRPEEREAAKQRLLANLDEERVKAAGNPFDIDFGVEEELVSPELPEPALNLQQIEEAMLAGGVRPPAMSWRHAEPGSWFARLPGMNEEARVATRGQVFDDHVENMAFFSPGGELFDAVAANAVEGSEPGESKDGVCWLLTDDDERSCRMVLATASEKTREISTLGELLREIGRAGPPVELDDVRPPLVAKTIA